MQNHAHRYLQRILGRVYLGKLVADLLSETDEKIAIVVEIIVKASPYVLLLNDFDYDHRLVALSAFAEMLAVAGKSYPYRVSLLPN